MTRYATEIMERRRAAVGSPGGDPLAGSAGAAEAAAGAGSPRPPSALPFDGPFEQLREGLEFTTAARPVEDADAFTLLALAARLVPLDPARVTLRRIDHVVFRRPVRTGDELHVEGRVEALAPGGEESGQVTLAWNVVDQARRCVCRARVELQWTREESCVAIPL
jgi:hypothetical protein